ALPLTPNGKVDRKRLPAPQKQRTTSSFVAPRTERERQVAEVWCEVLGVDRVSVHDDFFQLGGHSLLATHALAKLEQLHGVRASLRRFFEAPTVARFAAALDGSGRSAAIPRRSADRAPLSLMQQRLWFLEQLQPGQATYNLPSAFRLRGTLDINALERAVNEIIRRHDVLRTVLRWENEEAVQVVLPELQLSLTPEPLDRAELDARLHALAREPFELTRGPLLRVRLFELGPDEHELFAMPHHAIWDGWSFDLFLRELDVLYGAFSKGKPSPLAPLPISYGDFAAWHRGWLQGAELERQSTYWMKQLGGVLPELSLPTDRPRPAALSYAGDSLELDLTRGEVEALEQLGRSAGATLYMVLLTAFEVMLHRHSGQTDLLVGTPVRGRSRVETQDLLGFFVNTLVIRNDLSSAPTFMQLLERVRATCLDAFSHEDMPFELLVERLGVQRDLSRSPIYQAFFSFQDARGRNHNLGEVPFTQDNVHNGTSPTDISLWVKQHGDGMVGRVEFLTALFEPATMLRFRDQFRELLRRLPALASQSVAKLDILPAAERRQLESWNETSRPCAQVELLSMFDQQAQRAPDATALQMGGQAVTFQELHVRANQLAQLLISRGVKPGALVGLCVDRSLELIVGLLGILKAGAGYVPLDPAFPAERLAFMCEDAKLDALVTTSSRRELLRHPVPVELLIDRDAAELDLQSVAAPEVKADPERAAYVIYTSGSTGKPKGVAVPHRAVANFLSSMVDGPGMTASDTVLAVTTLSFDIAVLELLLPLTVGAKIVLASRETTSEGAALAELLGSSGA
ncbi:MAG: AMP-binding protein, partial [Deltaproteobacteria bacterium]|nr:AMP-binding protein [Deltaproteobacteria bacterium]